MPALPVEPMEIRFPRHIHRLGMSDATGDGGPAPNRTDSARRTDPVVWNAPRIRRAVERSSDVQRPIGRASLRRASVPGRGPGRASLRSPNASACPKSTVSRLLSTLQSLEAVEQLTAGGEYRVADADRRHRGGGRAGHRPGDLGPPAPDRARHHARRSRRPVGARRRRRALPRPGGQRRPGPAARLDRRAGSGPRGVVRDWCSSPMPTPEERRPVPRPPVAAIHGPIGDRPAAGSALASPTVAATGTAWVLRGVLRRAQLGGSTGPQRRRPRRRSHPRPRPVVPVPDRGPSRSDRSHASSRRPIGSRPGSPASPETSRKRQSDDAPNR